MNLKHITKKIWSFPKKNIILFTILFVLIYYAFISPKIIIRPNTEAKKMIQLEETKKTTRLSPFETDGCSGNVSEGWTSAVKTLSNISDDFSKKYSDQKNIPFESAGISHDKIYHQGVGGYVSRLNAGNQLRADIIKYGINNWQDIIENTPLKTKEEVVFVFEKIAEVIYRSVRVGGFPCSGQPYAWGYGYNNGVCLEDNILK